jgi:hypothetical protein
MEPQSIDIKLTNRMIQFAEEVLISLLYYRRMSTLVSREAGRFTSASVGQKRVFSVTTGFFFAIGGSGFTTTE